VIGPGSIGSGARRRFIALLRKETRQMLRDRSNLLVGFALPIALILLFGYGLSFDVTNAPVAVVLEDRSPTAMDVVSGLEGSPYLRPVFVADAGQGERLLRAGEVDGMLRVPSDFSERLARGDARIQLLLNGVDTNTANTIEAYVQGAIGQYAMRSADRSGSESATGAAGTIRIEQRIWFNAANTSTWYLVPGLLVLIMTLIGAFLTSLLIAREWERGTFEALFVTPVRPMEIILAKLVPYLGIGIIDLALCLLASKFLFAVPMEGSLVVILIMSLLYLLVSLCLGLTISAVTRNQFLASQVALLASFMPALMLSGFLFDLRNVPTVIRIVSSVLPATYFMELLKTLFLTGNNWGMIVRNGSILALYAAVLLGIVRLLMRKQLR
jgi:ABC-2 type transport system permease protein